MFPTKNSKTSFYILADINGVKSIGIKRQRQRSFRLPPKARRGRGGLIATLAYSLIQAELQCISPSEPKSAAILRSLHQPHAICQLLYTLSSELLHAIDTNNAD
jgi:hypothetical protein